MTDVTSHDVPPLDDVPKWFVVGTCEAVINGRTIRGFLQRNRYGHERCSVSTVDDDAEYSVEVTFDEP